MNNKNITFFGSTLFVYILFFLIIFSFSLFLLFNFFGFKNVFLNTALAIPSCFIYIILFLTPGFLITSKFFINKIDKKYLLLLSITFSSLLSYLIFWIYYFNHLTGKYVSIILLLISIIILVIKFREYKNNIFDPDFIQPLVFCFLTGCIYIGILFLYHRPSLEDDFSLIANIRFLHLLPPDNILPRLLLERIYNGETINNFFGEWLASDRPPLFTAIFSFIKPFYPFLIFSNLSIFYQFTGTFIQLFWIPALYSILGFVGFNKRIQIFVLLCAIFSGFFIINSVYIWPKLMTTAYFSLLFILVFEISNESVLNIKFVIFSIIIGICAALGMLSHGGIVFSLLSFGLAILINKNRMNFKYIIIVFTSFFIVYLPWILFQKFADPPGNRLNKWHLAGMLDINDYSFPYALLKAYSEITIQDILNRFIQNILFLFGNILEIFSSLESIRTTIFFRTFGAQTILNIFIIILLFYFVNKYCFTKQLLNNKYKILLFFTFFSFTIWPLLMFIPSSTTIHQGSYFNILLIYVFIAFGVKYTNEFIRNSIFVINIIIFILLWVLNTEISIFILPLVINYNMLTIVIISSFLLFYYTKSLIIEEPVITIKDVNK